MNIKNVIGVILILLVACLILYLFVDMIRENIKKATDISLEIENRKKWIAEVTNARRIKSKIYESESGRDISFLVRDREELFQIWRKLLVAEFEMENEQFLRKYYLLDKEESATNTKEE